MKQKNLTKVMKAGHFKIVFIDPQISVYIYTDMFNFRNILSIFRHFPSVSLLVYGIREKVSAKK